MSWVRERWMELDDTAKVSGMWTAGVTGAGAIITAPHEMSILNWLLGLVVTGALSIVSSLIVGLVLTWFNTWLKDRRDRRKAQEKGTFIQ